MAQYNGPVTVDISSWAAFKNATMGNGYNVDYAYGDQCVDYFKLLNYNLGYPFPYAETGTLGYAYEMWTDPVSKAFNQGTEYDLVTNINDLQIGDMVILGPSSVSEYGHNAIIDSGLITNPSGLTGVYAYMVGQNQVNPNPTTGHEVTRTLLNVGGFLGAYRLRRWNQTPPTPPIIIHKKTHFPWYLVTRKKLAKRRQP